MRLVIHAVSAVLLCLCFAIPALAQGGIKNINGGGGGGGSIPPVYVTGVEQRSSCDVPSEWFLEASNGSTGTYYRVHMTALARASVYSDSRCFEEVENTFDLEPGGCASIQRAFYNGPGRPCDDPCCKNGMPPFESCNLCTKILEAQVTVLAESPNGVNWYPYPTPKIIGTIEDGEILASSRNTQVINTCQVGSFGLSPCASNPLFYLWEAASEGLGWSLIKAMYR